jgi:hypothetical protein
MFRLSETIVRPHIELYIEVFNFGILLFGKPCNLNVPYKWDLLEILECKLEFILHVNNLHVLKFVYNSTN